MQNICKLFVNLNTNVCVCFLMFVPAVPCHLNLTKTEGYIEAPPQSSSAFHSTIDCSYLITVYLGYGVEVQVRVRLASVHLSVYLPVFLMVYLKGHCIILQRKFKHRLIE